MLKLPWDLLSYGYWVYWQFLLHLNKWNTFIITIKHDTRDYSVPKILNPSDLRLEQRVLSGFFFTKQYLGSNHRSTKLLTVIKYLSINYFHIIYVYYTRGDINLRNKKNKETRLSDFHKIRWQITLCWWFNVCFHSVLLGKREEVIRVSNPRARFWSGRLCIVYTDEIHGTRIDVIIVISRRGELG